MWVLGKRAVIEALKSEKGVERILIQEGTHLPGELMTLIKITGVPIQWVPKVAMLKRFGEKRHQGIAAYVTDFKYTPIEEILEETIKEKGVLLILDHLEDPQNVGNIMRSAEAFSVSGVILPKRRSSPITETVIKASQGAIFHLKVGRASNLGALLKKFKEIGGWVYALTMEGDPLDRHQFSFPLALVVGSEGKGISKPLLKISDFKIGIPMEGKIESLNVGTATGIALFFLMRGRELNP
jgi:23S rRNA (guanosine2251-2'-O)-methyltransferase